MNHSIISYNGMMWWCNSSTYHCWSNRHVLMMIDNGLFPHLMQAIGLFLILHVSLIWVVCSWWSSWIMVSNASSDNNNVSAFIDQDSHRNIINNYYEYSYYYIWSFFIIMIIHYSPIIMYLNIIIFIMNIIFINIINSH